jgi:hypothetical protein
MQMMVTGGPVTCGQQKRRRCGRQRHEEEEDEDGDDTPRGDSPLRKGRCRMGTRYWSREAVGRRW